MASLREDAVLMAGVALAVIGLAWYAKKQAAEAAKAVLPLIDPTSDKNLAYQGASALARWLAGQNDGTLGTLAWDYMHKAEPDSNGAPMNYTDAQRAADAAATRQLEAGFHGM